MAMLGTRLARTEHELLPAVAIGVHVHEELKPALLEAGEPEVRDLDRVPLRVGEHDAGVREPLRRVLPRLAELVFRDHGATIATARRPPATRSAVCRLGSSHVNIEAQLAERLPDGLALRIEDAPLGADQNRRSHSTTSGSRT